MKTQAELREEAIAQGYKDETCPKCGTLFEAHKHFVLCYSRPCPMMSTEDSRTLFERMVDTPVDDAQYTKDCAAATSASQQAQQQE